MEIKCQECGNYYKDYLFSCPTCAPPQPIKDNIYSIFPSQTSQAKKNLKKCKYCATMIPGEAKICPHCRKWIPVKISTLLIVALVIFGIGMWVVMSQPPSAPRTPPPQSDPKTATEAQIYREFEIYMNDAKKTIDDDKMKGQAIAANCMMQLKKYSDKRAKTAFNMYFDLK